MTAPKKYRRRYIVFKTLENLKGRGNIYDEVNDRLEDFPYSRILYYNEEKNRGIVKCDHLQVDDLKNVLKGNGIVIVGISGTIRKAEKKFITE